MHSVGRWPCWPPPADARAAEIEFRQQLGFLLYDRPAEREREYRQALEQALALAAGFPGEPKHRRPVSALRPMLCQVLGGGQHGGSGGVLPGGPRGRGWGGRVPATLAEAWRT